MKKKNAGCYKSGEEKKYSDWTLQENRQVINSNHRQIEKPQQFLVMLE